MKRQFSANPILPLVLQFGGARRAVAEEALEEDIGVQLRAPDVGLQRGADLGWLRHSDAARGGGLFISKLSAHCLTAFVLTPTGILSLPIGELITLRK